MHIIIKMSQKHKKKHSKRWAIFFWNPVITPYHIGKILKKEPSCLTIQYNELPVDEFNPGPEFWDSRAVFHFNNSLKAINFMLYHHLDGYSHKDYHSRKEYLIKDFLYNFPSEQKNLERLLKLECSQSKPKCIPIKKTLGLYKN